MAIVNPYGQGQAQWGERGQNDAKYWAYQAFIDQMGRAPTEQELAQAVPSFLSADPHQANVAGGNNFVSQMARQLQTTDPQNIQKTALASGTGEANSVDAQYQNLYPTLQKDYLNPLNAAIGQQQQSQTGLANQAMGQSDNLLKNAIDRQRGFNTDYMSQLQGIGSTQNDLLGQRMQSQRDQLMGQLTNGPEGEAFRQKYNNLGLLNSGAFNTGLANQFGNLASQQQQDILNLGIDQQNYLANAAGQGTQNLSNLGNQGFGSDIGINNQNYGVQSNLGLGGLNATQNTLQMPMNQGLGQYAIAQGQGNDLQNALMQRGFGQGDFNQESILANLLAKQGAPSTAQSILGMASGAAQGAGGVGQGYSATKSYICREMIKRGLLCESDFEDFYIHLFPAIIRKGRAFWNYYVYGQTLVDLANRDFPTWAKVMKPMFFDRVMEEKDPLKAVRLYSDAIKTLCLMVAPHLWDERNMRTSLFDSMWFLPRLMLCKPYRDNFWHIMRIKMAWVYDKPTCLEHRVKYQ